jgi:urease beta subunit
VDSLGVNLIIGIYRQAVAEAKTFEIINAGDRFIKVARFFRFYSLFSVNGETAAS